QINTLRGSAENGERNPRDIKADLAKLIISDFHSDEDANRADEEFRRIFSLREAPEKMEERFVSYGNWELKELLVHLGLAFSKAEARRLIEQGGVYVDGERCDSQTTKQLPLKPEKPEYAIKVGKRRFIRVRGE